MPPWPGIASLGRTLTLPGKGCRLFYYDTDGSSGANGIPNSGEHADGGGNPSGGSPPGVSGNGVSTAAGKPAVILIHGLGDEADSWRHLIPPLSAAGYRVLAPDLPGFGRSAAKGQAGLGLHAEAVTALAAMAGGPVTLAGSSMGAVVAETAALKRPDLVKALILIDGCFPMKGGPGRGFILMALPFAGKKWYRSFRRDHEGAWRSLFPYYQDLEKMGEEDRRFLRERVIARVESETQERAYFASLRSLVFSSVIHTLPFGGSGFTRRVRAFGGRILILWGAGDRVLPAETAAAFRALRPDAALETIDGAGHLPHQERPEETAAAMLRFLGR
jgi:pimeloyl-ACP methyl ester carboxylesterase